MKTITHVNVPAACLPGLGLILLCFAMAPLPATGQAPVALNGAAIEPYFSYPASAEAALVSFDWDADGALHYTVGDPNWGTKLEVYKDAGNGAIAMFKSDDVWAGSRLTRIGHRMYFNDGGDFLRPDSNYYIYDPQQPGQVESLLEAPYDASLWGLDTRSSIEFFSSGSASAWGPAVLFYSQLDRSGFLESIPPFQFGEVGESPGPMTFDPAGNLFYAPGYAFSGTAPVYRWSASAVTEALANPTEAPLLPDGHEWTVLPAPYDGATGLVTDAFGNVYVTATSWIAPSQLLMFTAGSGELVPLAEYEGRLETLRYRADKVYVSCADGIFYFPLLTVEAALNDTTIQAVPGETIVLAVEALGGIGEKRYQWYRATEEKAAEPVGGNLSHFSMTANLEDNGASFYCEVSDDAFIVQSPLFQVVVQAPVPAANIMVLMVALGLLSLAGAHAFGRVSPGR